MPKVVDCRGLSCPQPVIQTKQALEKIDRVTIIVDNSAARDNVARFGESQGGRVTIGEKGMGSISPSKKTRMESVVRRPYRQKPRQLARLWC